MKNNTAFSLLELSIVLVIIGLIAGGIVAGASMIRAAELRAVITELNKYQTAVHTFRDKYLAIPGDMKNATDFWGLAGGTIAANDTTCLSTQGVGTATCNGNGDRSIPSGGTSAAEASRFWQQLANAELIEGTYTGIDPNFGTDSDYLDQWPGVNSPASKLSSGGWGVVDLETRSGGTVYFDGYYGMTFAFGAQADLHALPNDAIMTPQEAWGIDKKIDDGRPARGKTVSSHLADCTDSVDDAADDPAAADTDSVYELSNDAIACGIYFRNVF